jgi:hypothetical protein
MRPRGGLRPTVGLRRPRNVACVGEGRRLACSAWRDRFQSARRPSADGRPACRMNSAWGGLRPTVGLRRPGRCLLRRRRPTLGVQRLGRPISIGTEAFGRRSACADRGTSLASAKADAWRAAPWKADFNRHEGLRPTVGLRRPRNLRPAVGLRRPRNVACVGEGRRLARSAWRGRFQSARRPSALGGPSANGRPAPTGGLSFASAKADARRIAPWKADFNRRGEDGSGPRWTVGGAHRLG